MENKILTSEGLKTIPQICNSLYYASYKSNRSEGVSHESLVNIGIGNESMKYEYQRQLFLEFCIIKKKEYLPIKGDFYGFNFSTDSNILISKNNGGALLVPSDKIYEIESELMQFLGPNNFFIYEKVKRRSIKSLI